jgi:SAM-dependent methyltransferase
MYTSLASWWPVLSSPEDYAEEAAFYRKLLVSSCRVRPRTVLELGSGGGNNASHLKRHFQMTLVDLAPGMLAVSRRLNPECEHIQGDMRRVRLGRLFDAVFVHDAITYMATEADLRAAIETAFVHCKPGGAAVFDPDAVRETFRPETKHGGHDREGRSMRYLQWSWDPDPKDTTTLTDFAYLLRDAKGGTRLAYDRHLCGLFPRAVWLRLIREAGFRPRVFPFEHSEAGPAPDGVFVGLKR